MSHVTPTLSSSTTVLQNGKSQQDQRVVPNQALAEGGTNPRLGRDQAIGAMAHRRCRPIWLILHQGVRYEERGPAVTNGRKIAHLGMIRRLRSLGYRIEPPSPQTPPVPGVIFYPGVVQPHAASGVFWIL